MAAPQIWEVLKVTGWPSVSCVVLAPLGTCGVWNCWDELRGDPGVDRGGDGGRGVGSHDSRPRIDSRDSVGEVNRGASAARSVGGAASLIFGRAPPIKRGRCGGTAETLRGLSTRGGNKLDEEPSLPCPSQAWRLSAVMDSHLGRSNDFACSFNALLVSNTVLRSPTHIDPLGVPSCKRAISGVMDVMGNDALDLRVGSQGRILVSGRSGSSTVKGRLNGHSVFSNCKIASKTSRSCCAQRTSSSSPIGTSIRQYWGRRICRINLLDSSSTHHTWLFGSIG